MNNTKNATVINIVNSIFTSAPKRRVFVNYFINYKNIYKEIDIELCLNELTDKLVKDEIAERIMKFEPDIIIWDLRRPPDNLVANKIKSINIRFPGVFRFLFCEEHADERCESDAYFYKPDEGLIGKILLSTDLKIFT